MRGTRRGGGRVRNQIFRRISGGKRAKRGNIDASLDTLEFEGGFSDVVEGIEVGISAVILARHNCTTTCNTPADVAWKSSMYGEHKTRGAGSTARHIGSATRFPHRTHSLGQLDQ